MNINKLSLGIWAYGTCSDRYVGNGYKPFIGFKERLERVSKLEDINGVEICYPCDINEDNIDEIKSILDSYKLEISCLIVEIVCDEEWKTGSFTSPNPERRKKTIEITKGAMKVAKQLGIKTINLWLGQDGFDYVFECNYSEAWNNLIEGLRECADYCPEINIGIEYKVSEPKMKCLINSGSKVLALANAVGRENIGAVLDVGHAINADENPAEIASILIQEGKLFHLHLNDNYRIADDDMIVGSVHTMQYLELLYWLEKLEYEGWYSLDLYPYREDASEACTTSIEFLKGANAFVKDIIKSDDYLSDTNLSSSNKLTKLYNKMFKL